MHTIETADQATLQSLGLTTSDVKRFRQSRAEHQKMEKQKLSSFLSTASIINREYGLNVETFLKRNTL